MIRYAFISTILVLIIATGCVLGTDDSAKDPVLRLDTTSLYFGQSLTENSFSITNGGDGKLSWWIEIDDADWIQIGQDAGDGDATITVIVDRSVLTSGEYSAEITVNSSGGEKIIQIHIIVAIDGIDGTIILHGEVPQEEGQL